VGDFPRLRDGEAADLQLTVAAGLDGAACRDDGQFQLIPLGVRTWTQLSVLPAMKSATAASAMSLPRPATASACGSSGSLRGQVR